MKHFLKFQNLSQFSKVFCDFRERALEFRISELGDVGARQFLTLTREGTHCRKGKYSESLLLPTGLSKNIPSKPSDSHLKQKFMSK